jgi:hypothetical protein
MSNLSVGISGKTCERKHSKLRRNNLFRYLEFEQELRNVNSWKKNIIALAYTLANILQFLDPGFRWVSYYTDSDTYDMIANIVLQ